MRYIKTEVPYYRKSIEENELCHEKTVLFLHMRKQRPRSDVQCSNDKCPSTTSVHHEQKSLRPQRLLSTRQ